MNTSEMLSKGVKHWNTCSCRARKFESLTVECLRRRSQVKTFHYSPVHFQSASIVFPSSDLTDVHHYDDIRVSFVSIDVNVNPREGEPADAKCQRSTLDTSP